MFQSFEYWHLHLLCPKTLIYSWTVSGFSKICITSPAGYLLQIIRVSHNFDIINKGVSLEGIMIIVSMIILDV